MASASLSRTGAHAQRLGSSARAAHARRNRSSPKRLVGGIGGRPHGWTRWGRLLVWSNRDRRPRRSSSAPWARAEASRWASALLAALLSASAPAGVGEGGDVGTAPPPAPRCCRRTPVPRYRRGSSWHAWRRSRGRLPLPPRTARRRRRPPLPGWRAPWRAPTASQRDSVDLGPNLAQTGFARPGRRRPKVRSGDRSELSAGNRRLRFGCSQESMRPARLFTSKQNVRVPSRSGWGRSGRGPFGWAQPGRLQTPKISFAVKRHAGSANSRRTPSCECQFAAQISNDLPLRTSDRARP